MNFREKAEGEYERLRSLIGYRHPFGDCQLVALMISRAIGGSIIDGEVSCTDGKRIWHFWAFGLDECIYDPLAAHWPDSQPELYFPCKHVKEQEVLGELEHFIEAIEYIPHNYVPVFPLRYVLTKELLGRDVPDIDHLSLVPFT